MFKAENPAYTQHFNFIFNSFYNSDINNDFPVPDFPNIRYNLYLADPLYNYKHKSLSIS